ncbi:MAG: NAD(P)/FAD-dependent oxidoreductase [Thermoleophilia bacterium]|nr:NAD(P)/FAD-dependent oxidoreductase [Thermoleophilia bacterium]
MEQSRAPQPRPVSYDVVIVGGGVAAGATASGLRDAGFTGSVAVFCAEPHVPYTRPGLTKQVLRGEKPESAALFKPAEWYAEHDVDLHLDSAVIDIDLSGATVRTGGQTIGYGQLVLATGAEPRQLPLVADLGVSSHVLRSIDDARRIRPLLREGVRWLVIGGGFIGAEFAASARIMGSEVDLVMQEPNVLERVFGAEAGSWFEQRLEAQGVRAHAETAVEALERTDSGIQVTLANGKRLEVDEVLAGVGVRPNTGVARQAGLDLDDASGGILVDQHLRTSNPRVFAVGDVAAYDSKLHGRRMRIEHWDVARAHGDYVARQIAGATSEPYEQLPYFFGTMGTWAFHRYVGVAMGGGVVRGNLDGETLAIAYLDDDARLVGMLTVDRDEDLDAARELVVAGATMDREQIAADELPLAECVAS